MALNLALNASAVRRFGAAVLTAATLIGAVGASPALARDDRHHGDRRQHVEQRHDNKRVVAPRREVRRWAVGRSLPRDIRPHRYDYWARHKLRRPPRGHYYARIGDDLLLIRLSDHNVVRFVFRF